jgi:alkylhydroperoxidase family enzyme
MSEPLDELRRLRQAAPPAPPEMDAYLLKVRDSARTVTDADVAALKDAGLSEDEIFEQTVAVAVAEGLRRLDRATAVIE